MKNYLFPENRSLAAFILFLIFSRIFFAHINSVASMESPIGIIMNAGPGKTIVIIPIVKTVNPITAITIRLSCLKFMEIKIIIWVNLQIQSQDKNLFFLYLKKES